MKEKDFWVFEYLIRAGVFILILLLVLALITSAVTGISMFDPAIFKMLTDIFKIALVVLGLLIVLPFIVIIFFKKGEVNLNGPSALVKDNALRYEIYEDGKKKKKTFNIYNIDKYLTTYRQMYVIDNMILRKPDPSKKGNANTLQIELPDKTKMTLRQLSVEDRDLYNRLCAFLDSISDLDEIALQFRLAGLIQKETIINSANETIRSLKMKRNQIQDEEVLKQLDSTIEKISDEQDRIDNNDTVRKLYEKYLKLLVDICDNYALLEKHNTDPKSLIKTKKNLLETFALIDAALDKADIQGDSEVEAEVKNIEEVLTKNQ
ncbi:MAG: hypothetical protein J6S49_04475 [Erysipelotrichaceae bacterium]|nr:hypothetical protein [Erysipelotrichaceae bacterium]